MGKILVDQFNVLFENPEEINTLRSLILSLAIRGKFRSLNDNSEPERMIEEDDALIKLKLRTNEQLPFVLPKGWSWEKLGTLVDVINGVSFNKDQVMKSPKGNCVRILRGGNIQKNNIILTNDDYYIPLENVSPVQLLNYGDIIMVGSTASKTIIGKAAFVNKDFKNVSVGAFLKIIRARANINKIFLSKIFFSDLWRNYISVKVSGTNINNIKSDHLQQFLVPIPTIDEQNLIVEKTEALFSLCEQLESSLIIQQQEKEKLKQLAMKEAINQ